MQRSHTTAASVRDRFVSCAAQLHVRWRNRGPVRPQAEQHWRHSRKKSSNTTVWSEGFIEISVLRLGFCGASQKISHMFHIFACTKPLADSLVTTQPCALLLLLLCLSRHLTLPSSSAHRVCISPSPSS